ncbi:MAG: ArsR family transcriptional regulator [Candidatus Omnitrophica bacterium]|nr:ArsR family transcriptional regulator [Candidatus Omnitrophota bacterium]
MDSKLELAQDKFIERIGKLCDNFGFNRFIAQLYAVLYLSDKPLSLDEIVEKLKVSKGNVSVNIRVLENWGAVNSVWVKGSRKDYYEANLDVKSFMLRKIKEVMKRRLDETSDIVDGFKDMIRAQGANETEEEKRVKTIFEDRLKKIEELKSFATTALTLVDKFV